MLKRRKFLDLLLAPWLASCRSAGADKDSLPSDLNLGSLDRAVRPQDASTGSSRAPGCATPRFLPTGRTTGLRGTPGPGLRGRAGNGGDGGGEAATAPAGSGAQRIGDLYLSFEAVGLEPLRPECARIGAIEDGPSQSH